MKKAAVTLFGVLTICSWLPGIEELVVIEKPFVVREVKGLITNETGGWPGDYAVTSIEFTLKGPGKSRRTWRVPLNEKGEFAQKLPRGKYSFYIKVDGWDDAEGTIIVSRRAPVQAVITISLHLS